MKLTDLPKVSSKEARAEFRLVLDASNSTPIRITRRGKTAAVLMSADLYLRIVNHAQHNCK